jgi:NADP-dependent 3-hydroxy acid dehydrogenase YdfG
MTPLTQRLAGKRALVTGAGSGIGRAIAVRLAAEGAHVTILELRAEAGEGTATIIREAGGAAQVLAADVADSGSMRAAFERAGPLHLLVNNAGISHVGNVVTTTPEDMDRIFGVNVKGVYHGLHFGVPQLLAAGGGAIVNLASIASKVALQDRFAYGMSKGAVLTVASAAIACVRRACTRRSSTATSRRIIRARKRRCLRSCRRHNPSAAWVSPTRSRRWSRSCVPTRRRSSPDRPTTSTAARRCCVDAVLPVAPRFPVRERG